ncbi:MAG TPA: fumarylacetoacetate hydrolase family protein [Pyrinomonadaceae bacterium]|nr:fumarylacetoacetate hydrolase family protein [Pyrinomonadaceae bacterium]
MKLCRFRTNNGIQIGIVEGDEIWVCDEQLRKTEQLWYFDEIDLLAPASPSKVVCVGRNYAEHAKELGNEVPNTPLLFLKAPSAIISHGDEIVIPEQSSQVEHEGELAVVIGRDAKNIGDDEDPLQYVLGYTCLNDVTARDIQRADVQFTRGKSFDTFCPIGPYLETELDVSDIALTVKVNGEAKQKGRTSQMVFPVDSLIRYISRQMTLKAGDVIATGTPSGVGKMESGDICEVEIEGIGTLSNHVTNHEALSEM